MRYLYDKETKEMIPYHEYVEKYAPPQSRRGNNVTIIPDIQPYKSMIDGSIIGSRSHHRAHLKAHNCIEVGNETKHLKPFGQYAPPTGLKEEIISVVNNKLYKRK